MAVMTDTFRLTPVEQAEFDEIVRVAKIRHERARKAAAKRGRHDFPISPYEGSWAHSEQFRRQKRG